MLPAGTYTSSVVATDGDVTASGATTVEMNAFAITTSSSGRSAGGDHDHRPERRAGPRSVQHQITQPGFSMYAVTMTKVATNVYRATIVPKTGGSRHRDLPRLDARRGRTIAGDDPHAAPELRAGSGPHPTPPYCTAAGPSTDGRVSASGGGSAGPNGR
jgi:hypothetical protein